MESSSGKRMIDLGSQLSSMVIIRMSHRWMRVVTKHVPIQQAIRNRLTFGYLHKGRSRRQFYVENVACFRHDRVNGADIIVAATGFYECVHQLCMDFGLPVVLVDETRNERITSPPHIDSLPLRIPQDQWSAARPWQQQATRIMNTYRLGRFGVATGSGKSHFLTQLASWLPEMRILISVKNRSNANDLYDSLMRWTADAGIDHSGVRRKFGRVQVVTSGSLSDYCDNLWDMFICDEVHQLMTEDGVEILSNVQAKRYYGFSANIADREDNADFWGEAFFGPIRLMHDYKDVQEEGHVVPIVVEWLDCAGCGRTLLTNDQIQRQRHLIWRNECRNRAFAERALHYHGQGKQVLVLTRTTEHALAIGKLLNWPVVAKPPTRKRRAWLQRQGLLSRDQLTSEAAAKQIQKDFEKRRIHGVVANSIWHVGADFPSLDVLCRADAGATEIPNTQIPGRLSRTYPGKSFGLLIDSRDVYDQLLNNRAIVREASYAAKGWVDAEKLGAAATRD